MKVFQGIIDNAKSELSSVARQLFEAERLMEESLDPSLASRHSLDRARVDMLQATWNKAKIDVKHAEILAEQYEASKESEELRCEYLNEQKAYQERLAGN